MEIDMDRAVSSLKKAKSRLPLSFLRGQDLQKELVDLVHLLNDGMFYQCSRSISFGLIYRRSELGDIRARKQKEIEKIWLPRIGREVFA